MWVCLQQACVDYPPYGTSRISKRSNHDGVLASLHCVSSAEGADGNAGLVVDDSLNNSSRDIHLQAVQASDGRQPDDLDA